MMFSALIIFVVLTYITLQNKKEINEIFLHKELTWTPGVCAPEFYPIEVYQGNFYTEEDAVPIAAGMVTADWGNHGMNMHHSGMIPEGFSITYFSYLENKFYTGKFELPKQKIEQVFKSARISFGRNRYVSYNALIVGMAPGGVLVVWMYSGHNQIELGRYQACESDLKWEAFAPTVSIHRRDNYVAGVISRKPEAVVNFNKNGLTPGLWDAYRLKYSWRPAFEFPAGSNVKSINLKMYNGETSLISGRKLAKNAFLHRACIRRVTDLIWTDETAQHFGAFIDFDETEMLDSYKHIYSNNQDQNAELVFKYNDNRSSLIVVLRSKTQEIQLKKCSINIFKRIQ